MFHQYINFEVQSSPLIETKFVTKISLLNIFAFIKKILYIMLFHQQNNAIKYFQINIFQADILINLVFVCHCILMTCSYIHIFYLQILHWNIWKGFAFVYLVLFSIYAN